MQSPSSSSDDSSRYRGLDFLFRLVTCRGQHDAVSPLGVEGTSEHKPISILKVRLCGFSHFTTYITLWPYEPSMEDLILRLHSVVGTPADRSLPGHVQCLGCARPRHVLPECEQRWRARRINFPHLSLAIHSLSQHVYLAATRNNFCVYGPTPEILMGPTEISKVDLAGSPIFKLDGIFSPWLCHHQTHMMSCLRPLPRSQSGSWEGLPSS